MLSSELRQYLLDEAAIWHADGQIESSTLASLRERYRGGEDGNLGVIKALGISAGLISFLGIMGLITALTESEIMAVLVTGGTGTGMVVWALRLAGDLRSRYVHSSRILLALGAVLCTTSLGILLDRVGLKEDTILLLVGLLAIPGQMFLAYKARSTFLLVLTLLGLFHWVGSWNSMLGRSTYAFHVQDPRAMLLFAAAAVGVGIWHERELLDRTGAFHKAWKGIGLVYLNMCLLILSVHWRSDSTTVWSIAMGLATLGQILYGSRFHDGQIKAFGVVFFSIGIYTRFHETFWDRLELGTFFLAGGGVLLATGIALEWGLRRLEGREVAR
ncbi:MAG: hypothetical protein H6686_00255 [Fibrobacteria bacterium]|nr:hypothetical protein [Fibrobacteria bacterium]